MPTTAPSALTRLIGSSANPLLTLSRLLIGLFLIWLGLTKCIPGWNPLEVDAQTLASALTQGKIDSTLLLYLIGGWQVLAGATLLLIKTARLAIVLLWLLIMVYGILFFFQFAALHDGNQPTLLASLVIRNALLTLAAIAITSRGVKDAMIAGNPATGK